MHLSNYMFSGMCIFAELRKMGAWEFHLRYMMFQYIVIPYIKLDLKNRIEMNESMILNEL